MMPVYTKVRLLVFLFFIVRVFTISSQDHSLMKYALEDTLRGTVTPERAWWNVTRYDIEITPDYINKSIKGSNIISYKAVLKDHTPLMQIDLKEPMIVDSVLQDGKALPFKKVGPVWYVTTNGKSDNREKQLHIHYHGNVHQAVNPPWDGGFSFTKDSLGRPWMTVTCQGEVGASIWYPCKDHQSDEPDNGASLTMTIPDTLVAIANGRLLSKTANTDGTTSWKWGVVNPISTYCIIPYIGKYVNFKEEYPGEKGKLDLNYWVLDYNLDRAQNYMPDQVHKMMKAFEHWFGPYPFYEDGYKLIETSNTGMEHQSAVSYGNYYKFGYRGRDLSYTGWGLKFDFIIVHESGHEWFGNNITTFDLADMWVHEGFTNYSETLFLDHVFGKDAANEYNYGIRKGIRNDKPIIPDYNVNAQGSGDMYPKGGNLIHLIRHSINNDEKFRSILRGLNSTFFHKIVTSKQVEKYVSQKAGFDYKAVFKQYLHTTQIPTFNFYFSPDGTKINYQYANCVPGFNLPIAMSSNSATILLKPTSTWKSTKISIAQKELLTVDGIQKMYYITPRIVSGK